MYKRVGAEARLLKMVFSKFHVDAANISPNHYGDRLGTIDSKLNQLISDLEELMLVDFPGLGEDFCDIFYGTLEPGWLVSNVDKEMYKIATGLLGEWLGAEVKQNV